MAELEVWEQENYQSYKDYYKNLSRSIRRDLSAVYGVLHSLCNFTLKNRLEEEADYRAIVLKQRLNAMVFHKLVRKTCNGSTVVVS